MNDVLETAKEAGLYAARYSPRDGTTRYRFFSEPAMYDSGDGMYTAVGRKEALVWLAGYASGRNGR